jgi:nucleoside-diphosphate kinase
MKYKREEKSLIIIKPDAVNRSLVGEIVHRLERKGLKIAAMKMIRLTDELLNDHYSHLADKPFFPRIVEFMKKCPVVVLVVEGLEAVESVRLIAGETMGRKADAGTIRGDLSMSVQANVVHASDSVENAEKEIKRFFNDDEIFEWDRVDLEMIYAEDEREG